jgi:hypothetical protein
MFHSRYDLILNKHGLREHLVFFTCQTIRLIVELAYVFVLTLLFRLYDWVVEPIKPGGFGETVISILKVCFEAVGLILIVTFVIANATSIVKWTVDRPAMKWLLRIITMITGDRRHMPRIERDLKERKPLSREAFSQGSRQDLKNRLSKPSVVTSETPEPPGSPQPSSH